MPKNHKPSKVSQALTNRSNGKYYKPDGGHLCSKSPTGSHRWDIATARGETSVGVCRYCNSQRKFANSLDASFQLGVA